MENAIITGKLPALSSSTEVVQSFIMTSARYDFNVYEKRILYCLVWMVQPYIKVDNLKNPVGCIEHEFSNNIEMKMFLSNLLVKPGDRKNYSRIKDAFESLQHKTFKYCDGKGNWGSISIIANPEIRTRSSEAVFVVNKKIWPILLDFSKGYSRYDIWVILSLESYYTMRFYEIMYSQKRSITVSIQNLRDLLCLQDKYKQPADLIARVVDSAKRELDRKSKFSFQWSTNKTGRKITSVTLTPFWVRKAMENDERLVMECLNLPQGFELPPEVLKLLYDVGFKDSGIRYNLGVFVEASRRLADFPQQLMMLKRESADKHNPPGWVLRAVEGMLKDLGKEQISF